MGIRFKNVQAGVNRLIQNMYDIGGAENGKDYSFANAKYLKQRNSAGNDVNLVGLDASDNVYLADQILNPDYDVVNFHIEPNADVVDQVIWISDGVRRVEAIYEIHKTKDTDSGTVTATIRKSSDGVTIANGTALCTALSLKTTNNTYQAATLSTTEGATTLAENDRISVDFSGVTDAAGICIVLVLSPGKKSQSAVYRGVANGDLADRAFFVANRPMKITGIRAAHTAAGTDGSAVTFQVTKDTSTDAPGGGDDILSSALSLKATINTVQEGSLDSTYTTLLPGDYLSIDFAGTLTAVAGLCVVVEFEANQQYKDVTYFTPNDGAATLDEAFFIADRNYEIVAANAVWSTASSGATNFQLVRDTGTAAPGAGTNLLSNDSSAGFQTDATANTPEAATWANTQHNHLLTGDRLSVDYSGTLTALVGVVATVTLKAE